MLEYKRRQKTLSEEQNSSRKAALKRRREMLLDTSGKGTATALSNDVKDVLSTIWNWYCDNDVSTTSPSRAAHHHHHHHHPSPICVTAAHRLWYRCGIQLAHLEQLLMDIIRSKKMKFEHFVDVVSSIVKEEQQAHSIQDDVMAMRAASRATSSSSAGGSSCGQLFEVRQVLLAERL
jgi:hypothetical protein